MEVVKSITTSNRVRRQNLHDFPCSTSLLTTSVLIPSNVGRTTISSCLFRCMPAYLLIKSTYCERMDQVHPVIHAGYNLVISSRLRVPTTGICSTNSCRIVRFPNSFQSMPSNETAGYVSRRKSVSLIAHSIQC